MIDKETETKIRRDLFEYMARHNMSASQMEKATGISKQTLLTFLHNRRESRLLTIARIQMFIERTNNVHNK